MEKIVPSPDVPSHIDDEKLVDIVATSPSIVGVVTGRERVKRVTTLSE